MCDEISRRKKHDERKNDDDKFYANTSFLIKKSFLRFVKGYPREEYVPSWPKPHGCVYPKANSYYAFHEDTNPFARFPSKCESRKYGNVQPHFDPPKEPYTSRDPYCEIEARKNYLASTPTCFLVLGKPDLNTAKLASMIANFWKCVLISPLSLIQEEIERGNEKGKIVADILKAGECLGPEIVMNLVASRLNKRDIFHRGYIVEGLPMIPNETLDYSSYSHDFGKESNLLESASQNLMKFFDREAVPKDSREVASGCNKRLQSKMCTTRSSYARFIPDQVENIFTTWPIKPSIIVYAMCPDTDMVKKREYFRLDPINGRTVDTSLVGMSKNVDTLFSHDKMENEMNVSFELYQELLNEERIFDQSQRKYLLKRPSDIRFNVEAQCALYKRHAMPTIERWILLHNPQHVIRIDARTPVSLMFQIVVSRLRVLPIPRVILAKRFIDRTALEFGGESPVVPLPVDEFQEKSNEEAFQELANRETVSPLFPWRLSTWNFLCPVELARGRTTEGIPMYTVRFMNKVFFLSSTEAVDLFCENPRTFLFPFSPRPTCKVVVFGPKYSGKSDLCNKLARMLRGTVINVNEIGESLSDIDSDESFLPSTRTTLQEKTNTIVEAIRSVPKEEIDIDVWRDGGYIVDGLYPNIDCWRTIVENAEIIFEDAVLLFDEDPYEYLLSKWHSIHDTRDHEEFDEERVQYFEDDQEEEEEEISGLAKYIKHIQQFQTDWNAMKETVVDTCRNLIVCDVGKIDDVSRYVMDRIRARYTDKARIMTEEEMERERDLAEYIAMADDAENIEEEEEMEGEKETMDPDLKEDNRRFGDTNYYCPVALLKHNIFWKGKEEFSAIFMDRIYHLSSAPALEQFLRDPRQLGLPLRKPLLQVPPFRVSIIGPTGSGKSSLADAIAREYGLVHVDYFSCFTTFMNCRGMSPVSHADVIVSPEDLLDEVELPVDLKDERYNTDAATVQTFVRHYWSVGNILPERMRRECLLEFFSGLYDRTGIVLDQFPSCPQDVDIALKYYTVPEVIVQLRCGKETAFERTVPDLLAYWQRKLDEKKHIEQLRYAAELEDYDARRDIWMKEMSRKTLRRRYFGEDGNEGEHEGQNENDEVTEDYALYDDDMESEEAGLTMFELEERWYQENPQPVPKTDWENVETARQRIEQQFQDRYEHDSEKIDAIRGVLENESIPYIVMDAEGDTRDILLRVMRILDPYIRRDVSILEKTYTVDLETADTLLDCGYYLLSSFGRWCPVQLRENQIPLQMFLPLETRQEISPVIHRQFIYFFGGKDAQMEFLRNPLKYLEQDSCASIVPFRLSILGPPKCGKTTLAQRFAKKYGVKVITRGAALRYVIKYFAWTKSAELAESRLRAGCVTPAECVYRAVEMFSIDPTSICQGFVLDGFPLNRKEYEELTFLGLQPMITLDLKASLAFCLDCLSSGADYTKKPPNFSSSFLKHRYAIWDVDQRSFRSWLKSYTENVIELDATNCRWYVWTRADREVCHRYTIIGSYFRESDYDKVHSLKYLSVSPYEFKRRQSQFESYCPLCLQRENNMKSYAFCPEHRGMVQFREHFYWICSSHMDEFVRNPESYIPPVNTASLPKDRPRILTETMNLEHSCWARRLQIGGFCLVTYVENLPNRKLVQGKPTIGVLYKDKVYLFCTEHCRDEFLLQPEKYAKIDVKFLRTLPSIDVSSLPSLGFLEQTVAKLIIEAVNQISVARPKLPGLSASVTAAIYIGVYLKAHNASCLFKDAELYKTIGQRIYSFEKMLKVVTRTMKEKINPFVHVPAYRNYTHPPYMLSGQLSMISRIFTRPSTSIVFRRTSPTQILDDPDNLSTMDG